MRHSLLAAAGNRGGGWIPADYDLHGWWDASQESYLDGETVTSVTDLSGNGRHLTEGVTKPIFKVNHQNSMPVLHFTGSSFIYNNDFAGVIDYENDGVTRFIVLDHAGAGSWCSNIGGSSYGALMYYYNNRILIRWAQGSNYKNIDARPTVGQGLHCVISHHRNDISELFLDGVSLGVDTDYFKQYELYPNYILGGIRIDTGQFTNGMIAESGLIKGLVDPANLTQYAIEKYAIIQGS